MNTSKTKEMVIDFSHKAPPIAPVNIQGGDIEVISVYKYLGVHLNNKLDWSHNTDGLYKKGQSRLHKIEVFWGVQAAVKDFLLHCCCICHFLCSSLLGLWVHWEGQEET